MCLTYFISFSMCLAYFNSFLMCLTYFNRFSMCLTYFISFSMCLTYFISFSMCLTYFISFSKNNLGGSEFPNIKQFAWIHYGESQFLCKKKQILLSQFLIGGRLC